MNVGLLVCELVVVLILTLLLLNKYGNWRKQHILVTVSTFVGWYFSFIIIFVLPLDIAITFYNHCLLEEEKTGKVDNMSGNFTHLCEQPGGFVPNNVLLRMWRVVYWTAQILTWIILPLMQSYSNAGDFDALGKLKSAAYNNVAYYGAYLGVLILLLIYASAKQVSLNAEHLKVILISASNTWGLFLLVVLLGYGLVEVPRQLWQMGSRDYRLNKTYFNIDKLSAEKNDAEDTLKEVYREARSVLTLLHNEHTLREFAQTVVAKFPPKLVAQITQNMTGSFSAASVIMPSNESLVANKNYLIRLHKRVISAIQRHHRTQAQWQALIRRALYLEDVHQAELTGQFTRHRGHKRKTWLGSPQIDYMWHVVIKRPLLKIFGALFFVMTSFIMWSECTFFIIHPRLSFAAQLIHLSSAGYHYIAIQISAFLIISYLCVCAYYTVFKLRLYRYYHLDPHHMTDENSLLFSAILLCRLTPPICLNVLGMIHLDSHITSDTKFGVETQFTKLMGHLDVIPILAKGINIYLPILIVLLCLGTWLRLGTRFLHNLGIDQFVVDDEMTAELVQGGKALVSLERNSMRRAADREERGQYWAEKLGDTLNTAKSTNSRNAASLSSSRFPGLREYSDREPIIGTDEGEEYTSFGAFDNAQRDPTNILPPTNMFDDL